MIYLMAISRFYLAAFGGMRNISETFLMQVSIIRFTLHLWHISYKHTL